MVVYLEVSCLKGMNGELVIKELTGIYRNIESLEYSVQTFLFKPPYSSKLIPRKYTRSNTWVTYNLHGIRWADGHISYLELERILYECTERKGTIYAKGLEKCKLLTTLIESYVNHAVDIFNLDDFQCPKHTDIQTQSSRLLIPCAFNKHLYGECTQVKALKYAEWNFERVNKRLVAVPSSIEANEKT